MKDDRYDRLEKRVVKLEADLAASHLTMEKLAAVLSESVAHLIKRDNVLLDAIKTVSKAP